MKILCIGNFPPRKCGIATFTENLVNSIKVATSNKHIKIEIEVIAMNDHKLHYEYPSIVTNTIDDQSRKDYIKIANYINSSDGNLVLFQHEYGIFGGNSGLLVLELLKKIKLPVVTTLHTILKEPTFHQKEVLKKIASFSERLIVMNSLAIPILNNVYGIPISKINKIEHGTPDFSKLTTKSGIPKHWKTKKIILTFGLLGRNKGLETVIKALPEIVRKHNDVLFVILGKTHPNVIKYAGEEYRDYLKSLAIQLNVSEFVEFHDKYVSEEELMQKLKRTDIYVSPYLNKAQITSGTLVYALAAGTAVISTPYWHAEEILPNGLGKLIDFKDYHSLSKIVTELFNNPNTINKLKQNASVYGREITWPNIGWKYYEVFDNIIQNSNCTKKDEVKFPKTNYHHLNNLTDYTGILQHASRNIASFKEGYCTDDNARAIILSILSFDRYKEKKYIKLLNRYISFMQLQQNEDGTFNNQLSFNKIVLNTQKPDDTFGRSIWALGLLIRFAPTNSLLQTGLDMFMRSKNQIKNLNYARGYANTIFGLYHLIQKFPDQEEHISLLIYLADKLIDCFKQHSTDNWHWFEPVLTYDNGILPASLYLAYEVTENDILLQTAEKSREFLEHKCFIHGHLSLIGNKSWWKINHAGSPFAQQPVDALAMIILYDAAFKATDNKIFIQSLKKCFQWFLGENDLNLPLYDDVTGGCNDGLEEFEVNQNQGAESTISYLLSALLARQYFKDSFQLG